MKPEMDCDRVARDEIVEQYLAGSLSDGDAGEFEEHYFRCPTCLKRLELAQDAAAALRSPARSHRILYSGLALAACLLIALGAALVWKRSPAPSEQASTRQPVEVAQSQTPPPNPWAELAVLEPPAYTQPKLRGASAQPGAEFTAGIKAYKSADYAQALRHLRTAAQQAPRDPQTLFFAGAAAILAGEPAQGIETLQSLEPLGTTPYLEESRFCRAKAYLQLQDVVGARRMLREVIYLHGDFEARAKELLLKITPPEQP